MLKTQFNYLKLRSFKILSSKFFIILFTIFFTMIIGINIFLMLQINRINDNDISICYAVITIIYSILIVIMSTYLVNKFYKVDIEELINKLELRSGFSNLFIFSYRYSLSLLFTFMFLGIQFLIMAIFYGINSSNENGLAYRFFISPMPWIVFIAMLSFFINILFTVLINSKYSQIFSTTILILVIALSSISANFFTTKIDTSQHQKSNLLKRGNINVELRPFEIDEKKAFVYANNFNYYLNFGKEIELNFSNLNNWFLENENDAQHDPHLLFEKIESSPEYKNTSSELLDITQKNTKFGLMVDWDGVVKDLKKSQIVILKDFGLIMEEFDFKSNYGLLNSIYEWNSSDVQKQLINQFYGFAIESFLFTHKGAKLDFIKIRELSLIKELNEKIKLNKFLNPLLHLNNLFYFENKTNALYDDLTMTYRPIFTKQLNYNYEIDYETEKIDNLNYILKIKNVKTSKIVLIEIMTLVYSLIFLISSWLTYLHFRKKLKI
ncbi:hypothetical protein ELUMI_v1c08190 [Williamsoniiplasma luminosum]|uniref:Uncharacterized protein n=1 Tax=Williamsoniiplasma luminosum TaxID=214888 RepID=A0A2K8NUM3_9MOLU|nr:hypothetical protein [Williamsoniiplasma luminosum]ATZ17540.1 hypothetical protein ELUMI_v1c08190 [Williamsoniiplasma luminosum]